MKHISLPEKPLKSVSFKPAKHAAQRYEKTTTSCHFICWCFYERFYSMFCFLSDKIIYNTAIIFRWLYELNIGKP